ncbi:Flp pilus assembly protein CpaB [Pseudaquidulcibacter saccharophilus]|uniref:Flp pilus assembly protein CpaB n=1 Tax=Pseudaquidulcibacter saccharophilus TaxID=2831900 RepID=UPI001EFF1A5C
MNVKQIAIIGVALVVAGGAFVFTQNQQPKQIAQAVTAPAINTVKVLVSNQDLAVGTRITKDSLIWRDWPSDAVGPTFITQGKDPKALEHFVGSVVKVQLAIGEPIVGGKLVIADPKNGILAALLTPGMRAVTINVKTNTSVAGFILPENRVDVILTRTIAFPNGSQTVNRTVSSTILENVRVLAIDQRVMQEKGQQAMTGSSATLELSPADSERLSQADSLGEISLALRSYADANGPTVARPNALALSQPAPPTQKNGTQMNPEGVPNTTPSPMAQAESGVKVYRGGQ